MHKTHERQCHIHVNVSLYKIECMYVHTLLHSITILLYTLVSASDTGAICCQIVVTWHGKHRVRVQKPFHWVLQRDIAGARSERPRVEAKQKC